MAPRWACAACCGLVFVLSLPCALGFNLLSDVHPLGPDSGFLDLEDFLVSNLALPGGALLFALFCTHRFGWGWDAFVAEANAGKGARIPTSGLARTLLRVYLGWILPLVIAVVLVVGLVDKYDEITTKLAAARQAELQKAAEPSAEADAP